MSVTFYHGPNQLQTIEDYCCRLTEECYLKGNRLLILTRDAEQTSRLDSQLWEKAGSFIPHASLGTAKTPIALSDAAAAPDESDIFHTLILAPGADAPDWIGRFRQVHYLVLSNEGKEHTAARETFRKLTRMGVRPHNQPISG